MISYRYIPVLCVLLGLALVPTWIHSYSGGITPDGLTTSVIPTSLVGYSAGPSGRNTTWGKRRFESDDWIERVYRKGPDEIKVTVVRSPDPKTIYHHPELAVAYGTSFEPADLTRTALRPDVPVYVLKPGPGGRSLGMYVLHYDGRFVDNPVWFQLRTAGELLFSRRKPMTLFFVVDSSATDPVEIDQLPATSVLFAAIDAFLAHPTGSAATR